MGRADRPAASRPCEPSGFEVAPSFSSAFLSCAGASFGSALPENPKTRVALGFLARGFSSSRNGLFPRFRKRARGNKSTAYASSVFGLDFSQARFPRLPGRTSDPSLRTVFRGSCPVTRATIAGGSGRAAGSRDGVQRTRPARSPGRLAPMRPGSLEPLPCNTREGSYPAVKGGG